MHYMTVVSGHLQQFDQHHLTICLSCSYDRRHGGAVYPKLGRVYLHTLADKCLKAGVGLDEGDVVQYQGLSSCGQGRTVKEEASTVPGWESGVLQQSGSVHIPSLFPGVQCPVSASILYLPERILAWVVAFSTSQGDEPHSLKIGWHLVKPINLVFMYCRDMRESACDLSMASQYCRMAVLEMDLTCSFVG